MKKPEADSEHIFRPNSEARLKANKSNAQKSSGPRTAEGKKRASKNAFRHGLSLPIDRDLTASQQVKKWTRLIVGEGADDAEVIAVQKVVEAQIDLLRIRSRRNALMRDETRRIKPPGIWDLIHADRLALQAKPPDERARAVILSLMGYNQSIKPITLGEGFTLIAKQLLRFDRYERRAFGRRSKAVLEYLELGIKSCYVSEFWQNEPII